MDYGSPFYVEKRGKEKNIKHGYYVEDFENIQVRPITGEKDKQTNDKLDKIMETMNGFQHALVMIGRELVNQRDSLNEYKEQDVSRIEKIFKDNMGLYATPDKIKNRKKKDNEDVGLTTISTDIKFQNI